jgi:hypothetical protein
MEEMAVPTSKTAGAGVEAVSDNHSQPQRFAGAPTNKTGEKDDEQRMLRLQDEYLLVHTEDATTERRRNS